MTAPATDLARQVSAQLKATKSLGPTQAWLSNLIASQKPTTPVNALVQTATFRILAADLTTCLEQNPQTCLPLDAQNATIKERRLPGPIVVQVLNIEDMSKSRWQQIEAIEALERGEGTQGRQIVRVVPGEEGEDPSRGAGKSFGPHKLLLQDARGSRIFGIELKDVEGVSLSMSIGSKMVLRNVMIARGVALLEPATTILLGGKIELLHKHWRENRKVDLKAAIEAGESGAD
ncbi:MAG: hypothetical protein MMC33_008121 [Icmadophila ericetorum]|nr:hypothetical protein [Icmadophila ericetorum]